MPATNLSQPGAPLVAPAQVAKDLVLPRVSPGAALIPLRWLFVELPPVGSEGVGARTVRV